MTGAVESRRAGELLFSRTVESEEVQGDYGVIVDDVVESLRTAGVDRARSGTVKDILIEYLCNIALHRREPVVPDRYPLIEVRKSGDIVTVSMEGNANREDLTRMKTILGTVQGKSKTEIWHERNRRAFEEKPFDTPGAGLGLLTIAALSSRAPLRLEAHRDEHGLRFALTSSV